jgi:hypothetical protein
MAGPSVRELKKRGRLLRRSALCGESGIAYLVAFGLRYLSGLALSASAQPLQHTVILSPPAWTLTPLPWMGSSQTGQRFDMGFLSGDGCGRAKQRVRRCEHFQSGLHDRTAVIVLARTAKSARETFRANRMARGFSPAIACYSMQQFLLTGMKLPEKGADPLQID